MRRTVSRLMIGVVVALTSAPSVAAQEVALKAAIAFSKLALSGTDVVTTWADGITTTGFGGHVRFRLGPILLQPELQMVTRGASTSATETDEQLRLEYLELPVLLAVPVRLGRLEPYAFGGGMVALESRCRYVLEESGLKSNFGCDSSTGAGQVFERRKADYGVVAGGGVSHPLGGGRILLEARHTWGMRNIVSSPETLELRNRTFMVGIGYTIAITGDR